MWSHAALAGSCSCYLYPSLSPSLPLSLPPSLRLNLILAAAKHFHQNLSDWRGVVSWHLLLFLSPVTSGVKERDGAREREGERERGKMGSSNLAQRRAGVSGWVRWRGTSGSPKTHFSKQPRFLGTLGDHENERISFPALFCSKPQQWIWHPVCSKQANQPHWSYCIRWKLRLVRETWRLRPTANIKCSKKSRSGKRRGIIARHTFPCFQTCSENATETAVGQFVQRCFLLSQTTKYGIIIMLKSTALPCTACYVLHILYIFSPAPCEDEFGGSLQVATDLQPH